MSNEEFSNEFDVMANRFSSIDTLSPLSFDEYEKSVFLTKAQQEVVESLYTGKATNDSFEDTEQLRRYLAELVKTELLDCDNYSKGVSTTSVYATLPPDLWFITYESAILGSENSCLDGKEISVVPVTQDEYHRVKDNPFRRANKRRVLRLDIDESRVELVSDYTISKYKVRYMAMPKPIILIDLPDGLTINKESKETECELNPGIHRMILEVAVKLAVSSRTQGSGK